MDPERERIQADLRGLLKGEVRCDDAFARMYAGDGSIFEIPPLGVVRPRNTADVVACVQYAAESRIPIHARGAGSGLAGESLGPGLVLDFSRWMRRIVATDAETVRVQPGVVLAALNRRLATVGRIYGPDPGSAEVTTIGGVLGRNAAGSRWLRYGSADRHVVSLQIVLADGHVLELGREPVSTGEDDATEPARRRLVAQLADLLGRQARTILAHQPKTLINGCGYHVAGVLKDGYLDLPRLLVGSEGTLALVTEATLRTEPLASHRGVALLFFDRLESAARAAIEIPSMGAGACDLMDRRLLSIAGETDVRYDLLIPPGTEAMLLVEFQADDPEEIRSRLIELVSVIQRRKRLAFDACWGTDSDEVELYWRLVDHVVPTLYRLKGSTRPLPLVEDIAIPPEVLPDFLVRSQNVLKKHQVTASLFAHAGHGQLQLRPFLDLADPEHAGTLGRLARDLYDEVIDVGGTITSHHADGLARSGFLRRQYGPLAEVFRRIKHIFDPAGILNPGKIVTEDSDWRVRNLRRVVIPPPEAGTAASTGAPRPFPVQLDWNIEDVARAARACYGCGACRLRSTPKRMCPIFRIAPREEASPRAKANLMRAVLTGRLDPAELTGESLKTIADLCIHCHQCPLECPARVDIPKLMVEWKSQYVAMNGLRPVDWIMTRLDTVAAMGSWIRPVANWALRNRQMRWLMEKTLGIAQGRKLPLLARRNFFRLAHRRRLTRPTRRTGRKVLYFVDLYAKWFDVQLADALVAVLEHNGVTVYVHPAQLPSAMTAVSLGALDYAKSVAARNVALLADAVRQGYHVVATEPAAALCLVHEYPNLLEDDDARRVADSTSEACTYLWRMHQAGKLQLDMNPISATLGYHPPCHLLALGVGLPGENLLRLVPGLIVRRIERGCSGMAGTFGIKRANYRSSLRAGWGLISALRDPTIQLGTTECSACKMQMEQGTPKPTVHPLKILALAYGLKPEIARLLTTRGEERVVT